jgi:hypothetical protein
VYSYTGGTSPYTVNLYEPIDVTWFSSGDYITADAENLDAYGTTLLEQFAKLGPGEKTASTVRLPRSYRHPLVELDWPKAIYSKDLAQVGEVHAEVTNIELHSWMYSSTLVTTLPISPGTEVTLYAAPYILTLNRLGFLPS